MEKRIRLGRCDSETKIEIHKVFHFEPDNVDVKYFEDDYISTLKDIGIILFEMFPCGAIHQLAFELSKRTELYTAKQYNEILLDIFKEYKNLSDEDAFTRFDNTPNLNIVDE